MTEILNRYQHYKHADEAVRRTVREELTLRYRDVRTADELTQMIQRHLNEHKVQQSDVTELCELEKQTESILEQVRTKKTQLMSGVVKNLQEEQKQLRQEKHLMILPRSQKFIPPVASSSSTSDNFCVELLPFSTRLNPCVPDPIIPAWDASSTSQSGIGQVFKKVVMVMQ
ncbi:hypothetical protein L1987_03553 [Smallanthus sonchifolius]|uniref:Uncharacterized protein n=1 Tax=Smallanthus sonchifolius TaxID=185202 RepID=A0ACB9KB01_9ASTR|nr:hypothetical protein L1987_03553 [Smallanthus sonchifolius]